MTYDDVKRWVGVARREELLAEDGLSFLRGMIEGRHPISPYADTMDVHLVEAEEGRVVFNGRPSARFTNPLGVIQGGWAATILDAAMALVVQTTLKAGNEFTSLEIKISFIRPVLPSSGPVRCEATVIHRGTRTATSEGRLYDERGKLLAHGSETCMIVPGKAD